MGEVIPFGKKQKKNLDIEMVFDDTGFGIHPRLLEALYVSKTNKIYFVCKPPEDPFMPICCLSFDSKIEACDSAEQLVQIIDNTYNKKVKIYHDKS